MKNIIAFMLIISFAASTVLAGAPALVVKQEGKKVYLDISDFQYPPAAGESFKIATYGDEIINPKTGKSLGRDVKSQVTGRIDTVEKLYAIGTLESSENVLGKEADITIYTAPTAFPYQQDQTFNSQNIMPLWRSAAIEGSYIAVATGDIDGAGSSKLALAFDDNTIKTFALINNELKQTADIKVSPLRKIISLDAADIKGTGRAQIFATVQELSSGKFFTLVFDFADNKLEQSATTIPGFVKGIWQDGQRVLYTQDILPVSSKFALSKPAKLIYKDNAFTRGDKLDVYKLDSVFGFNTADFKPHGKIHSFYVTNNHRIRVQFEKKSSFIESPQDLDFATTPNRVKYKNELVRLYSSLAVFKDREENTFIAAVENKSKLGMLADKFGSYGSARLHFLKWTGNGLIKAGSADIEGVVYDLAQGNLGNYQNVIIAPFTAGSGMTTVLIFNAK